jgi:hypothetical protein
MNSGKPIFTQFVSHLRERKFRRLAAKSRKVRWNLSGVASHKLEGAQFHPQIPL